jgi:hypothetical protein
MLGTSENDHEVSLILYTQSFFQHQIFIVSVQLNPESLSSSPVISVQAKSSSRFPSSLSHHQGLRSVRKMRKARKEVLLQKIEHQNTTIMPPTIIHPKKLQREILSPKQQQRRREAEGAGISLNPNLLNFDLISKRSAYLSS